MTIDFNQSLGDMVPDGGIPVAGIMTGSWLDPESGDEMWACHFEQDGSITQVVGLIVLTLFEAVRRYQYARVEDDYDDEDDE